jgi:chemotaxis protein MotB
MLQKLILPGVALFSVLISSCGTNKKLQAAYTEVSQLQAKNAELEKSLNTVKQESADQKTSYDKLQTDYSNYKKQCEATQEKLATMQEVLTEEAKTLQAVQEKLDSALVDFKEKGVDVYYKNGLVFVSMADNLLYKSGSAVLGAEGKKALAPLATVLQDYPNLKVIVLGNTDDVQVKKGGDNWSLSTERANGVVRVLRDQYKVDPVRLTAAGKGKYNPIAENTSAEGRAKNRRTDIILNPDIERVWNSVRQEQ